MVAPPSSSKGNGYGYGNAHTLASLYLPLPHLHLPPCCGHPPSLFKIYVGLPSFPFPSNSIVHHILISGNPFILSIFVIAIAGWCIAEFYLNPNFILKHHHEVSCYVCSQLAQSFTLLYMLQRRVVYIVGGWFIEVFARVLYSLLTLHL